MLEQLSGLRSGFLKSTEAGACAGLGQDVLFELDIYSSHNIACVMAYIVDLEIIMHRLSAIEIFKERVISTLKSYATSREMVQVHNDIRKFSRRIPGAILGDKDDTLDEIIRLIRKHRDEEKRA